ncbi:transmembrane sensor [Tenacibaculum sp. 190524A02b]|uniref:Transmembrane sensor n=1 Tax=Tenacibaculum vairaonense TaxID=3137860 RepID=A0ABM9PS12_9FLAO
MNTIKIDSLIVKLLENTINKEESTELKKWIEKDAANLAYFKDFVAVNHLINSKEIFDVKESFFEIEKELSKNKAKKSVVNYLKYALVFLITFSLGNYFYSEYVTKKDFIAIEKAKKIIGKTKAVLTLGDGKQIVLEKGKSYAKDNMTSNGEELKYEALVTNNDKIEYNYLTIPRGGLYHLTLSDGTKVWLNSDSKLKYPKAFKSLAPREVELLYGEAYFEVTSTTEKTQFLVKSPRHIVKVLGTKFNIKAYSDEEEEQTTLVEGKVNIITANKSLQLKPNEQITITSTSIQVNAVKSEDYIVWKEGVFNFKKMPLSKIMKVLGRWYNVDIQFKREELRNIRFIGSLSKDQNIEEILETIKELGFIKNYTKSENQITIE